MGLYAERAPDTYSWTNPYYIYFDGARDTLLAGDGTSSLTDFRADLDLSCVQNFGLTQSNPGRAQWNLVRDKCPALKRLFQVVGSIPHGRFNTEEELRLVELDHNLHESFAMSSYEWDRELHNDLPLINYVTRQHRKFQQFQSINKASWADVKFHISCMAEITVGNNDIRRLTNTRRMVYKPIDEMGNITFRPVTSSVLDMVFSGMGHCLAQATLNGTMIDHYDGIKELFQIEADDRPETARERNTGFLEILGYNGSLEGWT